MKGHETGIDTLQLSPQQDVFPSQSSFFSPIPCPPLREAQIPRPEQVRKPGAR